ncbi:MAG: aldo/keto reductase [Chloroflexota bacterium]|nr:aldo/keto reductase [Chloroflexota bacterium]
MKKTISSRTTLNDGTEIPFLGLGTWQSMGKDCEFAVETALRNGYISIDTAQGYNNEKQVGLGWKASGCARDEIFITTKINNPNHGYIPTRQSFMQSLKDLQTDYVDLLLIHWPNIKEFNLTIETWHMLVELQEQGLCRSIGVSNFTPNLIEQLIQEVNVVPSTNQVEFHAFFYQKELLDYCQNRHIQIEAYSPLARAKFLDQDTLNQVASKHNKSAAQVMLAWCINHNVVVIPKSTHEGRIVENADIFFDLNDEDMSVLDNLKPQTRLITAPWQPPEW